MNDRIIKSLIFPIAAIAFSCSPTIDNDEPEVAQPSFGSADSLSSVSVQETIAFDEAYSNVFDEDAVFHGYRFTSLPSGEVDIEITRKGSSSKLDTTLFLFGQKSFRNWERIAFDNDDGWGKLSKITDVEMNEDYSEYMIVVGTALGTSQGKYSLTLSCANGKCLNTTPVRFNSCNDSAFTLFEGCVENELDNADFGDRDPALEISIDYCVHDEGTLEYRHWECEDAGANAPDYCRASEDAILAVASSCETRLKEAYDVFDTIRLSRFEMPTAIEDYSERLFDSSDFVWYDLSGYRVPTSATSKQIGNSLRGDHPFGRALSVFNAVHRNEYNADSDELQQLKDLLEAQYGSSYYEVFEVSGSYAPAAGAEEWTTMTVFHFTRKNIVFVLSEVSGD